MKRIFYFNVTYGCNSKCIFCYSHNTCHSGVTHNEISLEEIFEFLEKYNTSSGDRVIINGGEPLLHSEIETILLRLRKYDCEVLIYTNGRLLTEFDFSRLTNKYRFIVPIHGCEAMHDRITGVVGSYSETLKGIAAITDNTKCLVDIKIIINKQMILEDSTGVKFIESLKSVKYNNAVHITKMADTIISIRNKCESVTNSDAAHYTKILYEYFKCENRIIKIFDTCIAELGAKNFELFERYKDLIEVYFKDKSQFRKMKLSRNSLECMKNCTMSDMCMSAVDEYKVLEHFNGKIYENLE